MTTKETDRCQILLAAFQDYVSASPHFDILFYPSRGYLYIDLSPNGSCSHEIESGEDLFETFLLEISNDVRDLQLCGEHDMVDLYPEEISESRRRLVPYLNRLPDALKTLYTTQMEFFFTHCNDMYNQ